MISGLQGTIADIKSGDGELDYEVVLFHLHQSAEKYLKSLLAFNNVEYPKIHDLEMLSQLCSSSGISTGMDIELLIELTDFACREDIPLFMKKLTR